MLPKGVPKDSLIPRLTLEPTGRQIALEWMLRNHFSLCGRAFTL